MKHLILFVILLQVAIYPSAFQLSTIVEDQQLIPVIKINGKDVIKIKNIGTKQKFSSTFERSEKIFNSLKRIQDKQRNLKRIRIRRNKSNYIAYVDNIELFRVTPSDIIGSDFTVYQMAKHWRDNIIQAIEAPSLPQTINEDVSFIPSPMLNFLSIFSNNSIIINLIQLLIFIVIQVTAIILTFRFLNKRYKALFEEFQKRLKKFNHNQIQNKHLIQSLEEQIKTLSKPSSSDKKNIHQL